MSNNASLILASGSRARNEMLRGAGLDFVANPADIDETAIIQSLENETPETIALNLAQQKALSIAKKNPDILVIGSDQILECDGQIFEKAPNIAAAKEKLKTLRGKVHRLISAVSIAQNSDVIWSTSDEAQLIMHDFNDAFLEGYMNSAEDDIMACVGGYALEKSGSWLFSDIKGDYFTILGMPLLPLLCYLREKQGFKP